MHWKKPSRSRAFTLLEVMLAIAIFSMVMVAIYSSWMFILRATKVGQEATAQVQRRRMAVWTIEDALTCVQSYEASRRYYTLSSRMATTPCSASPRGCRMIFRATVSLVILMCAG